MKFFIDCKDTDEAKVIYRKLAKLFHPDKGGSNELMIELQSQYDKFTPHTDISHSPFQYNSTGHNAGYRFNTINDNIPFNHSIHEQIRNKDAIISTLSREISILKVRINQFYSDSRINETQFIYLRAEVRDLTLESIRNKEIISSLESCNEELVNKASNNFPIKIIAMFSIIYFMVEILIWMFT